jgi:uncharacterized protein YjbI with pentapeptide repeats
MTEYAQFSREEVRQKIERNHGLDGDTLNGIDLREMRFPQESQLLEVKLLNCDLSFSDLVRSRIYGLVAKGVSLRKAALADTALDNSNFFGSDLIEANFEGATVMKSRFEGCSFMNARLERTRVAHAVFVDTDLYALKAPCSTFMHVQMSDRKLGNTSLVRADFRRAFLLDLDWKDANLKDANFEGAVLVNVDLSGANLHGANLRGASLVNVKLHLATLDQAVLAGCGHAATSFEKVSAEGTTWQ